MKTSIAKFLPIIAACAALLATGARAADGGPGAGGGSHSPQWAGAPVACLPDRAQRWDDTKPMQPCHCPPQSYCPSKETNLQIEDLDFHVDINAKAQYSLVINGKDTGATDPRSVFAMSQAEIYTLLQPKILELTGIDVNHLPRCQGCSMAVTIIITDVPEGFNDWLNDTLKLPILLASRCCDSICPAGMTPHLTKVEIDKPRDPSEGIHMSEDDVNGMIDDLSDLRTRLQAVGGLNAQVSATLDLRAQLHVYLDTTPATVDSLTTLKAALDRFNASLKNAAVPAVIKHDFEELLDKADAFALQVSQEIDFMTKPREKIQVDALSCTAVRSFPREGCLIEGTKITLANGTQKPIEQLTLDDVVKGNEGPAKIIALNKFTQREEFMYSINGGKAFFTVEHPVLTPHGWKSVDSTVTSMRSDAKLIGTLAVGDVVLMEGGKELKVESINKETVKGGVSAYNLSVEGDGSYVANGFILKGFKKLQMHY